MIVIPIKPISINQAWQGRRFMTQEYKEWREDTLLNMPKMPIIKGDVALSIHLHLKSIHRGDIDNFLKPIIDCLVKKGWIEDDRYIQSLEVIKIKDKKEDYFGIELKTLNL